MPVQKSFDYQKINQELDTILAQLSAGELDIEEATQKYQRGMQLVKELQAYLDQAENSVKKVKAKFDEK